MKAKLKGTRSGAIAAIVGGDVLLLILGWFMLVGPQRATAQSISRAAAATEVQVEQASAPSANSSALTQPKQPTIRTAYLYKLSKAMPMTMDMPDLLLELDQQIRDSGTQLSTISPGAPDPTTGASTITMTVTGDFYGLTDLLYRLRTLVAVHDGLLDVSGRLISVQTVQITPAGTSGSKALQANIGLKTFTFGSAAEAALAPPVTTPTDTSTDTTSTSG
ncbi:MAG TPA: type 4a pilus biogenesis protein PilO [Gaiellaceae bacterium]|nr:type 4a pilus biogenesis protein PilO [Gaiellaceae bacterium]